jgi:hypothetical protein
MDAMLRIHTHSTLEKNKISEKRPAKVKPKKTPPPNQQSTIIAVYRILSHRVSKCSSWHLF